MDPRFVDHNAGWKRVVSFTPWPFYPREKYFRTFWIGAWVVPRAGLDNVEFRKITQKAII
jgi:hypothetical protein